MTSLKTTVNLSLLKINTSASDFDASIIIKVSAALDNRDWVISNFTLSRCNLSISYLSLSLISQFTYITNIIIIWVGNGSFFKSFKISMAALD